MDDFKSRFKDDWSHGPVFHVYALLAQGMAKAHSTDPVKVAAAMEGLKFRSYSGEVEMRKSDHQLQQPLWISVWRKADAKNDYSVENTGYNFQPVKAYDAYVSCSPTSCQM
jgi:branched-chain amino acid transport system substrate-binding protein